jgi:hypothetical protein
MTATRIPLATTTAVAHPHADGHVAPDFSAVAGTGIDQVVGALLTIALIASVAMLVACAAAWAISSASGNWQATSKARGGLLVAVGGAVLTGGALAWANFLVDTGNRL